MSRDEQQVDDQPTPALDTAADTEPQSPATDTPPADATDGTPPASDPDTDDDTAEGNETPDGAAAVTEQADATPAVEASDAPQEPEQEAPPATEAREAPQEPKPETPPATEVSDAPQTAETEPKPETPPADSASRPVPTPATAPRPTPRPVPRPPTPGGPIPTPAAVASPATAPVPPALTATESAEAARWGRVDDDGTVWVREESGERAVGQYPGADPADALAFYVRRFGDLHAKVVLFEARLQATDLSVKEIDQTLRALADELAEPAAVGDLRSLRERLEALQGVAAERRAAAEAERAAAKEAAVAHRTELVEAAEKIAATPPEKMQWRPAGEQLRTLLERWKESQRHGPRVDRPTEDALWKRFSHARSTFDRERRRWFAELEKRNAGAKAEKEKLVAEAERLSGSTEWGPTSGAYRDLMDRWKAAGRASRKDDDALWARFRAAQDVFFSARDAANRQTDAEFAANLQVKLGLLDEAEKLVPVTDLGAAKRALRDIQDRWEQAGKVPRGDIQRIEGRLRAVETAVRDADQSQWRRTNPETRARAEGAAAQLYAAITSLEEDLEKAKSQGDDRRIREAQAALDARRAWLEQIEKAAEDSRG